MSQKSSHNQHRWVFMAPFLGLAGQKGNGKDTLGKVFLRHLPHYHAAWLATPVYRTVAQLMHCSVEFLQQWKNCPQPPPGWNVPVREALKFLGDGARQWDAKVWSKQLFPATTSMVIQDLRYPGDLDVVHEHHGLNVLVYRPGYLNDDTHPSEFYLGQQVREFLERGQETDLLPPGSHPYFDYFLVNDDRCSLDELVTAALDDLEERTLGNL